MKKSTISIFLTATWVMFVLANLSSISAQQTVEDQYWEAVKNSSNADDFKSYLKEYPNGKYAALARQKINVGNSAVASLFFSSPLVLTNEAFMERWESEIQAHLPIKYGDDEIFRASAPNSLEDYFYTSVRTPNQNNVNVRAQANALKAGLLSEYCKSEAFQRKITVVLGFTFSNNDTFGESLSPNDCVSAPVQKKVPISMELSLQTGIQTGANGRNRIPISRNDPANDIEGEGILWNPAIYLDVTFSDGTKIGPHDYLKNFAGNLIFDDVSGDPNDLIEISWWDVDPNNPQLGKFAAQLASTGKGVGTAYLKVSLRDNPSVNSSVKVEIVSGANQKAKAKTNVQFLNDWAAEIRVDLPEMVGVYKLIDAKSWCPNSECDYSGASGSFNPHMRLIFDAAPNQRSVPTAEIERNLKPVLLEVYCQTESIPRNLNLNIIFQNRDVTPYNFWVYPADCPKKI